MTEDFELHIVEIPKAQKVLEKDPNNKEILRIMKDDKNLEEAMDKLDEIS